MTQANLSKSIDKEEKISKEVRALRGKFSPLLRQKLKVAFHENHPFGLLEE